jgi:hypothetical protein
MINITSEDTLTLTQACALLPRGRNGAKPHLSTLIRWITRGAPGPDGRRVKLAAVRIGAKWITSRAALQEFATALTPLLDNEESPLPVTVKRRSKANERTARTLEKLGI